MGRKAANPGPKGRVAKRVQWKHAWDVQKAERGMAWAGNGARDPVEMRSKANAHGKIKTVDNPENHWRV